MQDKSHEVGYGMSTCKAKLGKSADNGIVGRINNSIEE